ncbi:MAG: hypothetical protein WCT52_05310 [Candidatus Micrarchaeia archaeon]
MADENKRQRRFEIPGFIYSAAALLLVSISGCSPKKEDDRA